MLRTATLAFAAAFLMSTATLACSGQTSANADHRLMIIAQADTSKTPPMPSSEEHHSEEHHSDDHEKHE